MDKAQEKHPKLYHLYRGLTTEHKTELSKLLGLNKTYMARLFQNTGKIKMNQLAIIVPFLENIYGENTLVDWNDIYEPESAKV